MLYITPIVIFGNEADARRGASLDLILQAGARTALENGVRARAQGEGALQRGDCAVDGAGGCEV